MSVSPGLELTEQEKNLFSKNHIPHEIGTMIRQQQFANEFIQLEYYPEDEEIEGIGIRVSGVGDMTNRLSTLREQAAPLECQVFLAKREYASTAEEGEAGIIGFIRSTDQFDIVKAMRTDGINYDIENEQVIRKLMEWDERYGLQIMGADYDWVEAVFTNQPEDMQAFANEVYDFCPDVVEQGAGSIEELARQMEGTNSLFLWWD